MEKILINRRGITLIALIITIIILLILAGVTIAQLSSNGLFGKVDKTRILERKAEAEEQLNLKIAELQIEKNGEANLLDLLNAFKVNNSVDIVDVVSLPIAMISYTEEINDKIESITVTVAGYEEYEFTIGETLEITKVCGIDYNKWDGEIIDLKDKENKMNTYTLIYNANGGENGPENQVQYKNKVFTIQSDKPTKEGCKLLGWTEKEDGTGTIYNSENNNITVRKNKTTLYAKWAEGIPPTVEITEMKNSTDYLFAIKATVKINDNESGIDFENCKYVFSTNGEKLGTDLGNYTDGNITQETTSIEQLKGEGIYYLHVLATDMAENKIEVISNNTVTVAGYSEYNYYTKDGKGEVQTASLLPGNYELEVYGAQGGNAWSRTGGKGGYSKGSVTFNQIENLYICVGGQGQSVSSYNRTLAGGYNGGGNSKGNGDTGYGSGGGATHITYRTNRGELYNYENNKSEIIIVAGGGGGAGLCSGTASNNGGTGGGTTGGGNSGTAYASGGTQTEGGKYTSYKGTPGANGSFGKGASSTSLGPGGGAGYYGGAANCFYGSSGAGGSGYLSGILTNATTSNGSRSGNGYAKITNKN